MNLPRTRNFLLRQQTRRISHFARSSNFIHLSPGVWQNRLCASSAREDRAQRIASKKKQMREEEEIDLVSPTGFGILAVAALIFAGIYKIDQEKSKGHHGSYASAFTTFFGRSNNQEDYWKKIEKYGPPERLPDDWGFFSILVNHIKNYVTLKGNWEGLYSKTFRLVAMPEKALLPPVRDMGMAQRTLIVDLDTVVHSSWSREKNYERTPRPYWSEFKRRMIMCGWEIIIFSNDEQMDWEENPAHLQVIDDKGFVSGMLWGKDTYYFNGHRCKDLMRLNRKPSNVVLLDSQSKNIQLTPQNAVILTPWRGENPDDKELEDIALFLEYLQKADVQDVREVIADYRGLHIPSAFRDAYLAMLSGG